MASNKVPMNNIMNFDSQSVISTTDSTDYHITAPCQDPEEKRLKTEISKLNKEISALKIEEEKVRSAFDDAKDKKDELLKECNTKNRRRNALRSKYLDEIRENENRKRSILNEMDVLTKEAEEKEKEKQRLGNTNTNEVRNFKGNIGNQKRILYEELSKIKVGLKNARDKLNNGDLELKKLNEELGNYTLNVTNNEPSNSSNKSGPSHKINNSSQLNRNTINASGPNNNSNNNLNSNFRNINFGPGPLTLKKDEIIRKVDELKIQLDDLTSKDCMGFTKRVYYAYREWAWDDNRKVFDWINRTGDREILSKCIDNYHDVADVNCASESDSDLKDVNTELFGYPMGKLPRKIYVRNTLRHKLDEILTKVDKEWKVHEENVMKRKEEIKKDRVEKREEKIRMNKEKNKDITWTYKASTDEWIKRKEGENKLLSLIASSHKGSSSESSDSKATNLNKPATEESDEKEKDINQKSLQKTVP